MIQLGNEKSELEIHHPLSSEFFLQGPLPAPGTEDLGKAEQSLSKRQVVAASELWAELTGRVEYIAIPFTLEFSQGSVLARLWGCTT